MTEASCAEKKKNPPFSCCLCHTLHLLQGYRPWDLGTCDIDYIEYCTTGVEYSVCNVTASTFTLQLQFLWTASELSIKRGKKHLEDVTFMRWGSSPRMALVISW